MFDVSIECYAPRYSLHCNYLSRFVTCFNKQRWCAVKNVFRYLNATINLGILYDRTNESIYLKDFPDSDYAGDLDTRRSMTGYVFKLAGAAITRGSLRQRTVSLSTIEAEYIAACEAVKEALWLKQLLHCDKAIVVSRLSKCY